MINTWTWRMLNTFLTQLENIYYTEMSSSAWHLILTSYLMMVIPTLGWESPPPWKSPSGIPLFPISTWYSFFTVQLKLLRPVREVGCLFSIVRWSGQAWILAALRMPIKQASLDCQDCVRHISLSPSFFSFSVSLWMSTIQYYSMFLWGITLRMGIPTWGFPMGVPQ